MGILGLLCQVDTTNISTGNHNIISLILNANIVVQLTILLLIIFSIVSWAIIGNKYRQLKKIKQESNKFYQRFWNAKTVEQLTAKGNLKENPAFNIFRIGIDALRSNEHKDSLFVEREIKRATETEIEDMQIGVSFLATTGSAAPFIGLFGTVWGILHAFWKIGRTGSSSLAIVGPHIAEALIATAIGLAAAIPAVIFYNIYVNKIRLISKNLDNFADDLIIRIQKEYK